MTTAIDLRDFPPVEENIDRPDTLSQTLLAKHDKCPRSAYLYRRYKRGSVPMDRGSAFHAVPERATEILIEQEELTIPGEVCRELATEIMAEHPEWVLPCEEQDAVRLMAYNWGESYVHDPETHLGAEIPVELELNGWLITGRIDRSAAVGSSLYLHDYKTSLNIRKREEVQRSFQGKLYGLLVLFGVHRETKLSFGAGLNDVWFYEEYPRYRDKDSGGLVAKEGNWSRAELYEFKESLERNLAQFERSLETGDWPARDDASWCGECPAQSECPIPAHLRVIEEISTVSEAEDAFSHKLALERESRRLQGGLRGWVQQNGPVYVGGHVFDAQVSEVKKVKDWDGLLTGLHRTAEFGVPFEVLDHIEIRPQTKFGKRKLTEEERAQ